MELADECWQHVGAVEIEIIVWPVQVRGHRRNEIAAVLTPVGLAQLDAGDLRDSVELVRRLERAAEQSSLGHRLGRFTWINARAAQIQQLPRAVQMTRV